MKIAWLQGKNKSPGLDENKNEIHEALPGMYLTESSVYVLNGDKQGAMTLIKNGEKIFDSKEVQLLYDGEHEQLAWDGYQGHTSDIVGYVAQASKEDLLLFFAGIYQREMLAGTKTDRYLSEVSMLLVDPNHLIPSFERKRELEQCNKYRIFDKVQYSEMALSIAAAKSLGDEAYNQFISTPKIRGILYDMSFDYNGLGLKPIQQDPKLEPYKLK